MKQIVMILLCALTAVSLSACAPRYQHDAGGGGAPQPAPSGQQPTGAPGGSGPAGQPQS
ncbi:hypothetical protein [Pantoea sp.]|uniref:hypothetical protein n=1 Tax=Pantoea sp. TaxID=69393 RepID=UPI00289E2B44|nr:hypothetical protein [Pantoea sp.]